VEENGALTFQTESSGVVPVAFIKGHKVIDWNESENVDLLSAEY